MAPFGSIFKKDLTTALADPLVDPARRARLTTTATQKAAPVTTRTTSFKPMISEAPDQLKPAATGEIRTGGQTTRRLLTSTLSEARRRARLTGRKLSKAEVGGITTGYFGQAGERLAARKGFQLQERAQDVALRGQDISAGLGYAGLTSAERIAGGEIELGMAGLTSAEKIAQEKIATAERMFAEGLISAEDLAAEKRKTEIEVARISGEAGVKAVKAQEQPGFFGGGGFLGLGCIIISACTSPSSYEVNISRQYRDRYMEAITRGGYYRLSDIVVPFIRKYSWFKRFIKKWLVDSIVDHSECVLGHKKTHALRTSRFIMTNFLRLCTVIGYCMPKQEVVERVLAHL